MKFIINNIKKIIIYLGLFLINIGSIHSFEKGDIDPTESAGASSIVDVTGSDGFDILDTIFEKFTEYIFSVIALVLIGVFIYVGYLFITSSGDEAQFKKAWKTFAYTIIGIIIIILSWGAVKLVATIGI